MDMDCSVEGCGRPARSVRSGVCSTHYARLRRSGRLDLKSAEERFWSKVDKGADGAECWLWTDGCDANGYARLWVKPQTVFAHRYAYELLIGPIPEGLTINHRCAIRSCVNPAHLEPETLQENVRLAHSANAAKTECPKGHALDLVNANGRRECSICKKTRANQYARRVRTLRRLDLPPGLLTVPDLIAYLAQQYPDEVRAAAGYLERSRSLQ